MEHHLEEWCPKHSSHDDIILYHSANYLKRTIIRNISLLIIRNDKLDKKRKDVNEFIKKTMSEQTATF